MKILVDADACPVKQVILKVAREHGLPVTMFIDTSHVIDDGYSQVITVDKSRDSVEYSIGEQGFQGGYCCNPGFWGCSDDSS